MIQENQLPAEYRNVIDEQVNIFNRGPSITNRTTIPDAGQIPLDNPNHWLKISNVICVFVDMLGSTKLSADSGDSITARAFQLFTGTAVRILNAFSASYIDVRGDGAFALFNSNEPYRALAAAITFKTFAREVFKPKMRELTDVVVGSHIGVDQKVILVRKLGLRQRGDRTDRQNEVWAGKPVNIAAKLASLTIDGEILVSDRYFSNITDDHALKSCGCSGGVYTGERKDLWTEKDFSQDDRFDFDIGWSMTSYWCENHGTEFCNILLRLDKG